MSTYDSITARIIEELEKGIIPWRKPWKTSIPMNFVTKKEYRGVNLLLLSMSMFRSPYWITEKQLTKLGGHLRDGVNGTQVVFWGVGKSKQDVGKSKSENDKPMPFMRHYTVFNLTQCEGIEIPETHGKYLNPIDECELVIETMPKRPEITVGGNVACYIPSKDVINMPHRDSFVSSEDYYSTLFHEAVHSTGHESRLNRKGVSDVSPFGSENYSKEELIAELGASFICGITGIESKTIGNNVSYLGGWLKRLKSDKRLIISAASQAQKAVDYIRGVQYGKGK